jgi:hypothetical protein
MKIECCSTEPSREKIYHESTKEQKNETRKKKNFGLSIFRDFVVDKN